MNRYTRIAYFTKSFSLKLMVLGLVLFSACKTTVNMEELKKELIETDLAFSALSKEKGMNVAFTEYVHPEGVLLRDNSYPIVGKKAITELLEGRDDSQFTLIWKPLHADVARSGELGYTYGVFHLTSGENVSKGTYVSIWKRNDQGKWRWILDSGNNGLGEE